MGASHREVAKAHMMVAKALKSGRLVKQPCRDCGAEAWAHHPDYSKPLDVIWLCPSHHRLEHIRLGSPLMESGTTLNLRNVPDELSRALKVEAAQKGITMKELCIKILSGECEKISASAFPALPGMSGRGVASGTQGNCTTQQQVPSPVAPPKSLDLGDAVPVGCSARAGTGSNSCPDCGALNGHQKWCKTR